MKDITRELDETLYPMAMLIAYRNNSGTKYHLESREIINGLPGAAKPVSKELLIALSSAAGKDKGKESLHGVIPSNLLYADMDRAGKVLCWYNPPQKRMMTFDRKAGIKDGEYNMPGVVYVAKGRQLWVYAFAGRRPSSNTRLLMGPFYNYYPDCRVCLGSAKIAFPDSPTWEDMLLGWEHIFWDSVNVHLISEPLDIELNKALRLAAKEPFNATLCKSAGLNLSKLLKSL